MAGLCPLIPVPFVDDLIIRRISRHMAEALFEAHQRALTDAGAKALTATSPGWVRGAASSIAMMPVRKVLHKVMYLLAIKDCADVSSAIFHDGWLLAYWLEHGAHDVKPGHWDDTRYLQKVRKAMQRTYKDIDPAPLRRALVGAFLGAKVGAEQGARAAQRLLRPGSAGEATADDAHMDTLVSRMRDAAMSQWQYIESLEQTFRHHLKLPEVHEELVAAAS